jgi:serine O-acetyltransferase
MTRSSDEIWQSIRREAEMAMARDPVFAASLSAAISDHDGLGSAVAHQIGERLGTRSGERLQFAKVAREAYLAAPDLVETAARDLLTIAEHDPAIAELLPPLLNYKGFVALQAFRVSNWLWQSERFDLARLLQSESSDQLQVSIHPSAMIGQSVYLDHATGIIIGASVEIGDEVTIMQNVTVGRRDAARGPRIGRGALLASGATIQGDVSIGDFAKVGAGAVVTKDVPAGCTAVGVPARLTNCREAELPAA